SAPFPRRDGETAGGGAHGEADDRRLVAVLIGDDPGRRGAEGPGGGGRGQVLGEDSRVPELGLVSGEDDGAVGGQAELVAEAAGRRVGGGAADQGGPAVRRGVDGQGFAGAGTRLGRHCRSATAAGAGLSGTGPPARAGRGAGAGRRSGAARGGGC